MGQLDLTLRLETAGEGRRDLEQGDAWLCRRLPIPLFPAVRNAVVMWGSPEPSVNGEERIWRLRCEELDIPVWVTIGGRGWTPTMCCHAACLPGARVRDALSRAVRDLLSQPPDEVRPARHWRIRATGESS